MPNHDSSRSDRSILLDEPEEVATPDRGDFIDRTVDDLSGTPSSIPP